MQNDSSFDGKIGLMILTRKSKVEFCQNGDDGAYCLEFINIFQQTVCQPLSDDFYCLFLHVLLSSVQFEFSFYFFFLITKLTECARKTYLN